MVYAHCTLHTETDIDLKVEIWIRTNSINYRFSHIIMGSTTIELSIRHVLLSFHFKFHTFLPVGLTFYGRLFSVLFWIVNVIIGPKIGINVKSINYRQSSFWISTMWLSITSAFGLNGSFHRNVFGGGHQSNMKIYKYICDVFVSHYVCLVTLLIYSNDNEYRTRICRFMYDSVHTTHQHCLAWACLLSIC